MNEIYIECPHCNDMVLIMENEINCAIFRHGVLKSNNQQIPPHSPKDECDRLSQDNLIWGCGKPFRLINIDNNYKGEICDYI